MKTDAKILTTLNGVLRQELTIINQYFLHARMLKNWGYDEVGEKMYKESIRAMKRADTLIERIFFLEGLPNLQDLGKLLIGENVPEAIDCDLKAATTLHQLQQQAVAALEQSQDYVSRKILKAQLIENESHIDWLEEQIGQISDIGIQNYLQSAVEQD